MSKEKIGLYIHIPFCKKICSYCDFPKRVSSIDNQKIYINALINEFEKVKPLLEKYVIKSIYIGGGTPSSVPNYLLRQLLSSIAQKSVLNDIEEFSIEANPEDIDDEFIKTIKEYIAYIKLSIVEENNQIAYVISFHEALKNELNERPFRR